MTAGDKIKHAAANAESLTKRVVDAVEDKVNDATDAVQEAVTDQMDKIHKAAGGNTKK